MINSDFLNGLDTDNAKNAIIEKIVSRNLGKKKLCMTQRLGRFKTKILGLPYTNDLS